MRAFSDKDWIAGLSYIAKQPLFSMSFAGLVDPPVL